MNFHSINPYNLETLEEYPVHNSGEIEEILSRADLAYRSYRTTSFEERSAWLMNASGILLSKKDEYARMITMEMGKPIRESVAEIEKCAWVCRYYSENASAFLEDEIVQTDASKSYVSFAPIGTILAIMPWNYPFWQVFRFAAPAVMAGNTALLKHAPNVFGCAGMIESIFRDAGFPDHIFQNLRIPVESVRKVLSDRRVKAVTLTGSERAGASVASIAGEHIKKSVLELGGSNAFIVLADADLEMAVNTGITARMQNTGQSCIAAKRFMIHKHVYQDFIEKYLEKVRAFRAGDPAEPSTEIGPLARVDLAETLESQVNDSIEKGSRLLEGGVRDNASYQPSVIENITPGMPAFDDELFGPVASFLEIEDENDAVEKTNASDFGLGATIFTSDPDRALEMANRIDDGAVFINEMVKSDPRLPFGGTKRSGYGRELSRYGLLEFTNIKTVYFA